MLGDDAAERGEGHSESDGDAGAGDDLEVADEAADEEGDGPEPDEPGGDVAEGPDEPGGVSAKPLGSRGVVGRERVEGVEDPAEREAAGAPRHEQSEQAQSSASKATA